MMSEQLFQFIWAYKLFDISAIKTLVTGQNIIIENVGVLNTTDGPDFNNAKIKINETLWAGAVELHINSSDWYKHGHQNQSNYNKIILHVVYKYDKPVYDNKNNIIPTLELEPYINKALLDRYNVLMQKTDHLPCGAQLHKIRDIVKLQQLENSITDRLVYKASGVELCLQETNKDWLEVFYIHVCKGFGYAVNAESFEALASRIPLKILYKHKNNLVQLEALLYGVAGLLPSKALDEYTKKLLQEWQLLKTKYSLVAMDGHRFKFMKVRPPNFPTIRLSQLAALIFKSEQLFNSIIAYSSDYKKLIAYFKVNASSYWDNKYTFKDEPKEKETIKYFGQDGIDILLINAIIPILFEYGKYIDNKDIQKNAIELLQSIPPENNKFTKHMVAHGFKNLNAYDSQALIHLFKEKCAKKDCLKCSIGYRLITKD